MITRVDSLVNRLDTMRKKELDVKKKKEEEESILNKRIYEMR